MGRLLGQAPHRGRRYPAARCSLKGDHRVSRSHPPLELLKSLPSFSGIDLIFPVIKGIPSLDVTLIATKHPMKVAATPHGLRASFSTWAQERTAYPADVWEHALAHSVGNKTTGSYECGDQFEKRVRLMDEWAECVNSVNVPSRKMVALREAA